ncbi:hypothetical protein GQ44DRAFT_724447 [Phaeosphaeriaceae sp. PMI808]|nr:hypothetical protein GQ44DRAFT_724447 [Phaeosphaeriaceae sp. PMI808]
MSPKPLLIPLRPGSDGDASHVPSPGTKTQVNPPTLYLEKVGQRWMEERGEARPGINYILESLPFGYTMWQRPRPGNPKHVDKYLYGHPQGRPFDSPNRFYTHFKFIMENDGSNIGCTCTVCTGSGGTFSKKPSTAPSRVSQHHNQLTSATTLAAQAPVPTSSHLPIVSTTMQHKGRPKMLGTGIDLSRVDEEGTPDVYRNLIDKLKRQGTIDELIKEPLSPDWRAEQHNLPGLLEKLKNQKQWIPRVGDLVLYIRHLPDNVELVRHEMTGEYELYDKTEHFLGAPLWEAGLVGETSVDPTTIADLQNDTVPKSSVIYSGIRVEPLPNPNESDKSLSKRHKYLSIRQTRPFILWKEFLHHVPRTEWHPTIKNALTVCSTLSLIGKYRFRGTWPDANIFCHGIHIGPEMLVVGDTVRLLPKKHEQNEREGESDSEDILVIKSVRLKLSNLDVASNNDYDQGRPYNTEAWVYGTAYTSNHLRINKQYLSNDNVEAPRAAHGYGEWYPLHPATKELAVPFSRISSRLYEKEAMSFFLSLESDDPVAINHGSREGLLEARAFACQHDRRIAQEVDATWYWADSRAEALDLHTINGLETTKYDQTRDIRELRKKIKVVESLASNKPAARAKPTASTFSTSSASNRLRGFMASGTTSLPHRAFGTRNTSVSDVISASSTGESSGSKKKRASVIDLSDDEDEDEEIRQYTQVIEEGGSSQLKRKAKVLVVID